MARDPRAPLLRGPPRTPAAFSFPGQPSRPSPPPHGPHVQTPRPEGMSLHRRQSVPETTLKLCDRGWTPGFGHGAARTDAAGPTASGDAPPLAARCPEPLRTGCSRPCRRSRILPTGLAAGHQTVPSSPWRWREETRPSPAAAGPPSGCRSARQHGAGSGRSVGGVQGPALRRPQRPSGDPNARRPTPLLSPR